MALALPALKKAQDCASKISNKEMAEVKTSSKIDAHIITKYVMDCVGLILSSKQRNDIQWLDKPEYATKKQSEDTLITFFKDGWDPYGKAIMNDSTLLQKLLMMADTKNENLINGEILELLEPYTIKSKRWLTQDNANNASGAIGKLYEWVV